MFMLMVGTVHAGFEFFGPFNEESDAEEHALEFLGGSTWEIVELTDPGSAK
jgi:hypothetical protein